MSRSTLMHDKNFHALLALVSVAFLWVLWPFWGAVFWGTVLAIIFNPVQRWLVAHLRGRRNLAALLTLFEDVLRVAARGFYDAVTGVDVIAAVICDGVKMIGEVGERLKYLLRLAARWAEIHVANEAALTDAVIRAILQAMTSRINQVGIAALQRAASLLRPAPLLLAGSLLISASAL